MSVSTQTLLDALVAIAITVGIALAISIAIVAAGAVFDRDQAKAEARRSGRLPAQHRTQADDVRDLVLR